MGPEYKEAFALFDKKGTGTVPRETLGDLLRALGQNPTQAEVAELVASSPREGTLSIGCEQNTELIDVYAYIFPVDYKAFLSILNRPDGFKPAGTPGLFIHQPDSTQLTVHAYSVEEFIRGFQVFDKEGNGYIGAGELRYVLTQLGEKMTDEEVDELLKGVQIGAYVVLFSRVPSTNSFSSDGNVNYESFVRTILSQ